MYPQSCGCTASHPQLGTASAGAGGPGELELKIPKLAREEEAELWESGCCLRLQSHACLCPPHCSPEPGQPRGLRGQVHIRWVQPRASAPAEMNSPPLSFLHATPILSICPFLPTMPGNMAWDSGFRLHCMGNLSVLVCIGHPRGGRGQILFALIHVLFVRMKPTLNYQKISQRIQIRFSFFFFF